MSARDVMAEAILNAGMNMGALSHRRADTFEGKIVDFQIEALTAAGFSIVHKDEIHAPSAHTLTAMAIFKIIKEQKLRKHSDIAKAIAAALRELMKEVG